MSGRMPRFARVELVLGARLDDVAEEHLQRLVDEAIAESEDLDFKKGVYWQGDNKRELGKDVASLANHIGGLLIVGVAEDGNARAIGPLNPVNVDDATERRVQEIVADHVHPTPYVATRQVEGPSGRFLLIAVPRSPSAPHALQKPGTDDLAYPVRSGTRTRWLSETEVADRYRSRFGEALATADRATERIDDVVGRLHSLDSWLVLVVVPEVAANVDVDATSGRRVTEWMRQLPGSGIRNARAVPDVPRVRFGPRRFVYAEEFDDHASRGFHVELFADGSALVAFDVSHNVGNDGPYHVPDSALFEKCFEALGVATWYAIDFAGVSGTALAVAQLVEPRRKSTRRHERSIILTGVRPAVDAQGRRIGLHSYGQLRGTNATFDVEASRHTTDLGAVRDSVTERLVATHLLLRDIVQAFGLAEPRQVAASGALRWAYFDDDIKPWAQSVDVAVEGSLV